jgi:hypothetical protein
MVKVTTSISLPQKTINWIKDRIPKKFSSVSHACNIAMINLVEGTYGSKIDETIMETVKELKLYGGVPRDGYDEIEEKNRIDMEVKWLDLTSRLVNEDYLEDEE